MTEGTRELVFERLAPSARLEDLEDEWRALEPELPRLPFVAFDWMFSWWQTLRARKASVSDGLYLCTARDKHGHLRGVMPLIRTDRPALGPFRLRQLQLFGADPNITEIRSVIAPPAELRAVLALLVDHVCQHAGEWDFMQLTGIPANLSDVVPQSTRADHWTGEVPNYYLPLKPTWEAFRRGLSRNMKESLRKCYNAPKRDGIAIEFDVVRDPSQVRAAVAEFRELHRARAALDTGVKHPDVFASADAIEFLHAVCQRFAERDRLRIFRSKVEGRVIATRIGFVCGDCLYLYYSGYDPAYGRYSVMTTTDAEAIQFAIREGFSTANLSTGSDVSKLRWGPKELVYRNARLVSPSLRSAITLRSYSWVRRRLEGAKTNRYLAGLLARRG